MWRGTRPEWRSWGNRFWQLRRQRLSVQKKRLDLLGSGGRQCGGPSTIPARRARGFFGRFARDFQVERPVGAGGADHQADRFARRDANMRLRAIGEVAKACRRQKQHSEKHQKSHRG